MRVLRYYPRAWVGDGGITNSLRRVSEAMVRAGAEVHVAIDDATGLRQDDTFLWVPVPHRGPDALRRPVGLASHLEGASVVVMHSAWTLHNVVAGRVAHGLDVPYILEPRGAYDPRIFRRRAAVKTAWWWSLERRLVMQAAAIHVFFESEVAHLRSLGYDGPVIRAPNGIAIPQDARWDGGSGGYVLWIGRFDPEHKGIDLLLHGLHTLPPQERPPVRLHGPDWVGGKDRVARLVAELGLDDWVTLGDPVYGREKWDLITRAAAFCYPSRWEGFGNSAAEAVAAGVPTLVTPYPFGRWLDDRGSAVMVEASPAGLAEGLRHVLGPDARARAEHGRRVLEAELTWDAVARSWLDQVRSVLGGPHSG
jgi:glycosyltransferase involved in cell wall biosynthesis